MANEYTIRNTRGTLLTTITPGTKDDSTTSLVLQGRGMLEYGLERDQNLVFLLENFSNGSPPSNPIDGQFWWKTGQELFIWDTQAGSPTGTGLWEAIVPPPQEQAFVVEAGAGLIGGGLPTLSPLITTLTVGVGTGIRVGSPTNKVSTKDSEIVHDDLSGFVANEHIDHTAVILEPGAGIALGSPQGVIPGELTASRTFNVGAGDGIVVGADIVGVDNTVVRTIGSPIQTIAGIKTFTDQLLGDGTTTTTAPSFAFDGDSDTGIFPSAANEISFVTGGRQRLRVESDGTLSVPTGSPQYELLVTEDDDIPNKKYVDSGVGFGSPVPTANTFIGTSSLSGLDPTQKYLVIPWGLAPAKGTGRGFLIEAIEIFTGSTTPLAGKLFVSTATGPTVDWADGAWPQLHNFIVDMSLAGSPQGSHTSLNCVFNHLTHKQENARYMIAVQLTDN